MGSGSRPARRRRGRHSASSPWLLRTGVLIVAVGLVTGCEIAATPDAGPRSHPDELVLVAAEAPAETPVTTTTAAPPTTTTEPPPTTEAPAPAPTTTTAPAPPPPPSSVQPGEAWARELLGLVNGARSDAGLAPLRYCHSLERAARAHAADLATMGTLSHTGSDGSSPGVRATRAGYVGWRTVGENIAVGQTTARSVFDSWMASPGHRANILKPDFQHVGFGRAEGDFKGNPALYWDQAFGAGGSC